jgi:hypothetical protein
MPLGRKKQQGKDVPGELARRLAEALARERVVPRFVDSYVIEHNRQSLQVHATLYRDLLALLQREALLAASVRTLEIASMEPVSRGRSKQRLMPRKGAGVFRRRFLDGLAWQQGWTAGDALEFQSDLRMYEDVLARNWDARRAHKPFEAANHPFVDRCAFLLDSSFLEKARVAASKALTNIEAIVERVAAPVLQT